MDWLRRRQGDRVGEKSRRSVSRSGGLEAPSIHHLRWQGKRAHADSPDCFPYDSGYPGEALPLIQLEFRQACGSPGVKFDRVIPDTGADASVLPWADCQVLQLSPSLGVQGLISGVAGGSAATLAFQIWAMIDGQEYPCRLQADFIGNERILGRDVMNCLEFLFRGPAGEMVINP